AVWASGSTAVSAASASQPAPESPTTSSDSPAQRSPPRDVSATVIAPTAAQPPAPAQPPSPAPALAPAPAPTARAVEPLVAPARAPASPARTHAVTKSTHRHPPPAKAR